MGLGGEPPKTAAKTLLPFTRKEVAAHNTPDDAWMIVNNKVYDVTNWSSHPGGTLLFTHAGFDASDVFGAFHPASAHSHLAQFKIGYIEEDKEPTLTPFEVDVRAVKAKLRSAGLLKANPLYYVYKCLFNVGILAAAVALVLTSSSFAVHMVAAVLVALFWQQNGWLSHDFLHHQVFRNRFFGDLMGYLYGNVFQGFSVAWWKNKHNTHHAVPNLHASQHGLMNGDPDIATAPLLAWSASVGRLMHTESAVGRFCLKYQALLYFPILFFARMSWLLQSALYVFRPLSSPWGAAHDALEPQELPHPVMEAGGLLLYYAWNLALMWCMPLSHAIGFALVAQTMCGLFLAIAFGVGHNGMAVYDFDKRPAFSELQVTTTRNVHGNPLVGWFMGGLHLQVEHHLFPYVPRHHLPKVRTLIEPLCAKHNIPYRSTTLWDGTMEVLQHLGAVTHEVLEHFPAM